MNIAIGIVGLGGVGKALIRLISDKRDYLNTMDINLDVKYVLNSRGAIYNQQGLNLDDLLLHLEANDDISTFVDYVYGMDYRFMVEKGDIDLLVELTPTNKDTGEPAMSHIRSALTRGLHVVTANKGPIMIDYDGLYRLAKENNVQLAIGCTTGGALPTINAGIIDMAGSEISELYGVLNGTTNYILKEMEDTSCTYMEALTKAQSLGIAETNPSLDVEGWDTAIKLTILGNALFNKRVVLDDVSVQGITDISAQDIQAAKDKGMKYKLIARGIKKGDVLSLTVKPELVDRDSKLYGINNRDKGLLLVSDTLGELFIMGGASGVTPAAASVLRDIVNIARGYRFVI